MSRGNFDYDPLGPDAFGRVRAWAVGDTPMVVMPAARGPHRFIAKIHVEFFDPRIPMQSVVVSSTLNTEWATLDRLFPVDDAGYELMAAAVAAIRLAEEAAQQGDAP